MWNAQTQVVIPDGVNPEPTATSGNIGANGPDSIDRVQSQRLRVQ
jgi:hypothetical protein